MVCSNQVRELPQSGESLLSQSRNEKVKTLTGFVFFCFSNPIQAKLDGLLKTKKGSKQSFDPFSFLALCLA